MRPTPTALALLLAASGRPFTVGRTLADVVIRYDLRYIPFVWGPSRRWRLRARAGQHSP